MTSASATQPFVFTPNARTATNRGPEALVDETRREIAEIVREVAGAVRSNRSRDEFLTLLVDRVLRAMAAEGVIVWRRVSSDPPHYTCTARLGRITDLSIPAQSVSCHERMLLEVASDGQPVVVPATPGATDKQMPANPMDVPAAVVTIECESSAALADYVLEVFLEPNCGIATQRGYLRFVAQMADLAGEFLRMDRLRALRRERHLSLEVDSAVEKMHGLTNLTELETYVVDAAAELFGFDRVGLCRLGADATLVAVSHVNRIDQKSPAAEQIRRAALMELDSDGCRWLPLGETDDADDPELDVWAVVGGTGRSRRRLVCLACPDDKALSISEEYRESLNRFMRHASLAFENTGRLEAIPGSRLLASLAPMLDRGGNRWKPLAIWGTVAMLTMIIAIFPVPLVVYAPATVRPDVVQTVSAPRSAIVDEIHVHHSQQVKAGTKLITLTDADLEEQTTELLGRRAVLTQQRSRASTELLETAATRFDKLERLQREQEIAVEEIRSIDDQLAVLDRISRSLIIRADRDGVVDAWQVRQRLLARPIERGQTLLRVIATDSSWMIDVEVPQSRVAHLQRAATKQTLAARVALDATPDQTYRATLQQIGPAIDSNPTGAAATAVLLRIDDFGAARLAGPNPFRRQAGAPARVMFRCGTTPAAYLVLQDVVRSLRGMWALYLSPEEASTRKSS